MVEKAASKDSYILAKMAKKMWDSSTVEELEAEFSEMIKNEKAVFFVKYVDSKPAGFAQCCLRNDYVEGTESSPVGYLEGIFVEENYRNKGYAKELLSFCEKWAKDKGCSEFASDCELVNTGSLSFHKAMGFDEVNCIICFKKNI